METAQRRLFLVRLVPGIESLAPAASFEIFGRRLLGHLLGISLNHRGLNLLGNPVRGSVDAFSDCSEHVAEFSIQKDYFNGNMSKPKGDFNHALREHPQVKTVFLVSSQEAGPVAMSDLTKWAAESLEKRKTKALVYDARRLAECIVDDLIFSDSAIDALAEYLPELRAIRDEHSASDQIPKPPSWHLPRVEVQQQILTRMNDAPFTVVAGIGGIGKSQEVAYLATNNAQSFTLRIWLDSTRLKLVSELSSWPIARSGTNRNITNLLRTQKVLLVLDNLLEDIEPSAFAGICGPNSKIVATRIKATEGAYRLPLMTREEARAILDTGETSTCSDISFESIWQATNGHPLSLRVLKALASRGFSWEDLAADCHRLPSASDGSGQTIGERLTDRLVSTLRTELSIFRWLNSPVCDRQFLRSTLGIFSFAELKSCCLSVPDRPSVVRLHDIVFNCLTSTGDVPLAEDNRYRSNFAASIVEAASRDDLRLTTLATNMRHKVRDLVTTGDRRSEFVYCLIKAFPPQQLSESEIGEPFAAVERLEANHECPPRQIDILVVLEAIETIYRIRGSKMDLEKAKEYLRSKLPVFDRLSRLENIPPRSRSEISNHQAKCLKILSQFDEAKDLLLEVIRGDFPLNESKLQLARLFVRSSGQEAEAYKLLYEILASARQKDGTVSPSVILATVDVLKRGELRTKLINDFQTLIKETIISSAHAGSDQGYETLAALGNDWSWSKPEFFLEVLGSMPALEPSLARHDRERESYAKILNSAASASLDADYKKELLCSALAFLEAVEAPRNLTVQNRGKILYELGDFASARSLLQTLQDEEEPFIHYYLAKAESGLGLFPQALKSVNVALGCLGEKNRSYTSTMLALRAEILLKQREKTGLDDLVAAIDSCTDPKFREILVNKLDSARREYDEPECNGFDQQGR